MVLPRLRTMVLPRLRTDDWEISGSTSSGLFLPGEEQSFPGEEHVLSRSTTKQQRRESFIPHIDIFRRRDI